MTRAVCSHCGSEGSTDEIEKDDHQVFLIFNCESCGRSMGTKKQYV